MRKLVPEKLEQGRLHTGRLASDPAYGFYGAFSIQGPCGAQLNIIASGADDRDPAGWEHVSVSLDRRPPNWQEMCFVKDLCWEPEECVVQFHPPMSQYINCHPHCLHLWRKKAYEFPLPPSIFVGPP